MRSFVNRDAQRPACRGPRTHALPAARATRACTRAVREGKEASPPASSGRGSRRVAARWFPGESPATGRRDCVARSSTGSRGRGHAARTRASSHVAPRTCARDGTKPPSRPRERGPSPRAPSPALPSSPSSRGVACTAFLRDGDLAAADTGAPAPGEHDDEAGKSPRRHFTDRMKSAIDEGDHASALAAFDDMAQLYPDNQGVLAYELLIKLAARCGRPRRRRRGPGGDAHGRIRSSRAHARQDHPRV